MSSGKRKCRVCGTGAVVAMAGGADDPEIMGSIKGRSAKKIGDGVADLADAAKISFDKITPNPWQRDRREVGIS
jgi:hypothetical protein